MSRIGRQVERSAPIYNLKAVVKETGLKPPTLRAWERRYGFPNPTRTKGGHRKYSQRDIDTLHWLIARQDEGMIISHAIEMWRSLVEAGQDPTATAELMRSRESAPSSLLALGNRQLDELREAWIRACLAFEREAAEGVLTKAFALYPPEVVCVQILQNGLVKMGEGWHRGEVTVQQEHFASALSLQRLEMLIASAAPPWRRESIIVATVDGDFHTFGALLFTFLLRRRGWDVIYLGASVPARELEATIDSVRPHLVILTAQLLHTAATLKEVAEQLQSWGIKLAFGGAAFNCMADPERFIPGHFLGHTLDGAVQMVPSLVDRPPVTPQSDNPADSLSEASARYSERRAFIEAHVEDTFNPPDISTDQVAAINSVFGLAIDAALRLGDINLVATDLSGIQDLLSSHLQPASLIYEYVMAYYQAASNHLDDSASIIVDWLSHIVSD